MPRRHKKKAPKTKTYWERIASVPFGYHSGLCFACLFSWGGSLLLFLLPLFYAFWHLQWGDVSSGIWKFWVEFQSTFHEEKVWFRVLAWFTLDSFNLRRLNLICLHYPAGSGHWMCLEQYDARAISASVIPIISVSLPFSLAFYLPLAKYVQSTRWDGGGPHATEVWTWIWLILLPIVLISTGASKYILLIVKSNCLSCYNSNIGKHSSLS